MKDRGPSPVAAARRVGWTSTSLARTVREPAAPPRTGRTADDGGKTNPTQGAGSIWGPTSPFPRRAPRGGRFSR